MYGIPEFRLPKAIVQKRWTTSSAGGGHQAGLGDRQNTASVDELFASGYSAVFLGTGAGLPMFLNVPGENFCGIYSAIEFLTRVNLMHAGEPGYATPLPMGSHVAVVGGGNVAMDAARCALRAGADRVSIVYRRTKAEAPARAESRWRTPTKRALISGGLTNPVRFLANARAGCRPWSVLRWSWASLMRRAAAAPSPT
jgi:glutamate synthase (NADPH/NADH) small chain